MKRTELALALALVAAPGCNSKPGDAAVAGASASEAVSAAPATSLQVAVPVASEEVAKVVNPAGVAPYTGPTGTLKGVVRMEGDEAPTLEFAFPSRCSQAVATHGRLFRVGQDKTLADVLVTVSGYEGKYLPARDEAKKLTLHACAAGKRTIALMFGQRLDVSNLDKSETYMPYLDGAPFRAVMVAIPGGEPVKLYPQKPGHYLLRDQLPKGWLTVDTFVLPYATADVTDSEGTYEIKGIPVGKVRVGAVLPILKKSVEKDIDVKEGENTLDLSFTYDAKKDGLGTMEGKGFPSPMASASATPSAAPSAKAPAPPK